MNWLDPSQAINSKVQPGGAIMHSIAFVLSILGFGLELTAFLLTVAVL
jgi:hypothetical protein